MKEQTAPHASRRLYILFLFAFAVFGMIFTIAGAALPQIIRTFGWSYTLVGAVIAASAIGYAVSTFLCGWLAHRFPPKAVLITGIVIGAVSMSLFVRWPSPWLNLLLNLGVGLCQGALEVVSNLEVIHMERKGQSRMINLLHATFCIGAIAGPAALGFILKSGLSMITVFTVAAGLLAVIAVLFALSRFPRIVQESAHGGKEGVRILRQPFLLLVMALLLLYVGVEIGVSSWVSEYFVKILGSSASTGAYMVALYWTGLLIGRVAISFFYKGTRQELIMLGLASMSAVALLVVLLVHSTAAVAAAMILAGLGLSGFYPLALSVMGRYYKSSIAVGGVTTGGAVGSVIFPFVMSVLAQTVGIRGGFWFYMSMNVVLAGLTLVLVRTVRSRAKA